jgi:hypothetical protein
VVQDHVQCRTLILWALCYQAKIVGYLGTIRHCDRNKKSPTVCNLYPVTTFIRLHVERPDEVINHILNVIYNCFKYCGMVKNVRTVGSTGCFPRLRLCNGFRYHINSTEIHVSNVNMLIFETLRY